MIFKTTEIEGAYTVELDKRADSRGFFARGWCCQEFDDRGLPNRIVHTIGHYDPWVDHHAYANAKHSA